MTTIYQFFGAWKDLIIHIWSEYTLAASIATLLCVGAFVYLKRTGFKEWNSGVYVFCAFLAWAIVVPLLGVLFQIIGMLWRGAVNVSSASYGLVLFLYQRYEKHPILVLILLLISVAVFLFWQWRRPRHLSWALKAIACVILFLLGVAICIPIANLR